MRYFDPLIINNIFKQFYSVLYHSHYSSQKHDYFVSFFNRLTLPVISEEQRELLNAPISREEAIIALHSLKSGKSPGPDGLACEFYKEFEHVLLDPLLAMLNHSFSTDRSPPSLREANISLILKKGKDPENCGSYRPIALLDSYLKLLSKILALRLEKVLPYIIHEDQTGFIKGRISTNNVRRLLNIIELSHNLSTSSCIVSLDAEKPFDSVEWPYLFYTLEKFGTGEYFIKWVRILYKDPLSAVITNGHRADHFSLSRGTRQGCPLSPLLFAIAMEPFAQAIGLILNLHSLNALCKTYYLSIILN